MLSTPVGLIASAVLLEKCCTEECPAKGGSREGGEVGKRGGKVICTRTSGR